VFAEVVNLPALREVVHDFGLSARHGFLLLVAAFAVAFLSAAFPAFVLSALHDLGVLCHFESPLVGQKKSPKTCVVVLRLKGVARGGQSESQYANTNTSELKICQFKS
jgi:hypothetical protein